MAEPTSIVWFRPGDLRLADNPALLAAIAASGPVIPVFTWTPAEDGAWSLGAASRWWLNGSLAGLEADLRECGSRLIVRSGSASVELIARLSAETHAHSVFFNRACTLSDRLAEANLARSGMTPRGCSGRLLLEPSMLVRQNDAPFRVFSAFWRAALPRIDSRPPVPAPTHILGPTHWPASERRESLELLPSWDWAGGLRAVWQPGEASARLALERFIAADLRDYAAERDAPGRDVTTRLSAHLRFGEISARQVWHALQTRLSADEPDPQLAESVEVLRRELGWREFANYQLYHHPHMADHSLEPSFDTSIAWRTDKGAARAWQRGQTGYPLVDAGMRQLWQTGWMHNRVRMVVASFLVKDLLLPWQSGARWFWDTLVDADLANNSLGWQWAAGSGPDAAPFTRVFNPTRQAERFDPTGAYIRRYVPELARLPPPYILQPWTAPPLELAAAGVRLDDTYPAPIVDHDLARKQALQAVAARRSGALRE